MIRDGQKYVGHLQIAAILGVKPRRIADWQKAGHFPAPRFRIASEMFYPMADFDRLVTKGTWFKERGAE